MTDWPSQPTKQAAQISQRVPPLPGEQPLAAAHPARLHWQQRTPPAYSGVPSQRTLCHALSWKVGMKSVGPRHHSTHQKQPRLLILQGPAVPSSAGFEQMPTKWLFTRLPELPVILRWLISGGAPGRLLQ